jgi:hypothetical protein
MSEKPKIDLITQVINSTNAGVIKFIPNIDKSAILPPPPPKPKKD